MTVLLHLHYKQTWRLNSPWLCPHEPSEMKRFGNAAGLILVLKAFYCRHPETEGSWRRRIVPRFVTLLSRDPFPDEELKQG